MSWDTWAARLHGVQARVRGMPQAARMRTPMAHADGAPTRTAHEMLLRFWVGGVPGAAARPRSWRKSGCSTARPRGRRRPPRPSAAAGCRPARTAHDLLSETRALGPWMHAEPWPFRTALLWCAPGPIAARHKRTRGASFKHACVSCRQEGCACSWPAACLTTRSGAVCAV